MAKTIKAFQALKAQERTVMATVQKLNSCNTVSAVVATFETLPKADVATDTF